MKIESPAFKDGERMSPKFAYNNVNVNPHLKIKDVPDNARTLALIMVDPDASNGDWIHWVVWNIAPNTTEIEENSVPDGAVQGVSDFRKIGYGGPCPPSGTHRYFFRLYALDTFLIDLDSKTTAEKLEAAMEGHIIEKAEFHGLYSR